MNNKAHLRPQDFDSNGDIIPMACKEERPQGEWHEHLDKGLLKARHENYVVYDVDYLLDNLAREVSIMESARKMRNCGADMRKGGAE